MTQTHQIFYIFKPLFPFHAVYLKKAGFRAYSSMIIFVSISKKINDDDNPLNAVINSACGNLSNFTVSSLKKKIRAYLKCN